MIGPEHPLDPVGPVVTLFRSVYGARCTGHQYEDGWLVEIRGPIGAPFAPDGASHEVQEFFQRLHRAVTLDVVVSDRHFTSAYWISNALYERDFPNGLPEPLPPAGQIPVPQLKTA